MAATLAPTCTDAAAIRHADVFAAVAVFGPVDPSIGSADRRTYADLLDWQGNSLRRRIYPHGHRRGQFAQEQARQWSAAYGIPFCHVLTPNARHYAEAE